MTDPEPIDAEFEPADDAPLNQPVRHSRRSRSPLLRPVTFLELGLGVVLAAVGGAVVGIVATGRDSSASTGTLAREIDKLLAGQEALVARADETTSRLVEIRAQIEAQSEDLADNAVRDQTARADIAALDRQLTELVAGVSAEARSGNPLAAVLDRLAVVEDQIAQEDAAPRTTSQMQRSVKALTAQVQQLSDSHAALSTTLEQRQLAVAVLEAEIDRLNDALAARSASAAAPAPPAAAETTAATSRSRLINALASVEALASEGRPFAQEYGALLSLLPKDKDVAALKDASRRGAPALGQLRADFDLAAADALRLAATRPDDGWNWLRTAVAGAQTPDKSELLALSERQVRLSRRALEAGDVRAAIAAIDPAGAFKDWRARAVRRAELSDRLRALNTRHVRPAG
jgi:hypothetical protein